MKQNPWKPLLWLLLLTLLLLWVLVTGVILGFKIPNLLATQRPENTFVAVLIFIAWFAVSATACWTVSIVRNNIHLKGVPHGLQTPTD